MFCVRTQLTQHIQMELPLMLMGTWAEGRQGRGAPMRQSAHVTVLHSSQMVTQRGRL